jgi:hypothetical protein
MSSIVYRGRRGGIPRNPLEKGRNKGSEMNPKGVLKKTNISAKEEREKAEQQGEGC